MPHAPRRRRRHHVDKRAASCGHAGPAFAKMAWHVPPLFALLRFLDSMGRSSAVCLGAVLCWPVLCCEFLLQRCLFLPLCCQRSPRGPGTSPVWCQCAHEPSVIPKRHEACRAHPMPSWGVHGTRLASLAADEHLLPTYQALLFGPRRRPPGDRAMAAETIRADRVLGSMHVERGS